MTDTTNPALAKAADGKHINSGIPHGFTSLTPFLAIPSAKEAITFYQDVFGARTVNVTEMGGIVVHAELEARSASPTGPPSKAECVSA